MKYLYEMHCHTCNVSPCGQIAPAELVRLYKQAKYSGAVITNHYSVYSMDKVSKLSHKERMDYFLSDYREALEAAGDDFKIFLGAELRPRGGDNEYLLYGLTEEFLYSHSELMDLPLNELSALTRENGILLFQAHPFRENMRIVNPKFLDGIETYNGSFHDSRNDVAELWADKYGLLTVAGSDFHQKEHLGRGGIRTDKKLETINDVVDVLVKGNFELIRNY